MELDEAENIKLARCLSWGSVRMAVGDEVFYSTKHLIWLDKGAWDVGALLAHGCHPKLIVPVTEDPDLAMEAQEKYPEVKVICADPLGVVRYEGRVFASIDFGFYKDFSVSFVDQFIKMVNLGIKDGGATFLVINPGHPEGDEILARYQSQLIETITRQNTDTDDRVLDAFFLMANPENRKKMERTIIEKGPAVGAADARRYLRSASDYLGNEETTPKSRANGRAFSFLKAIVRRSFDFRFHLDAAEIVSLEDKNEVECRTLVAASIRRGSIGESVKKFENRICQRPSMSDKAVYMSHYNDTPGWLRSFYEYSWKGIFQQGFRWDWYYSVDPATIEEWKKEWLHPQLPHETPSHHGTLDDKDREVRVKAGK